jgi:hypothetical protein
MSYQQYPPAGGAQPTVQQPGAPFAGAPAPRRTPALIGLGALVLAVGIVTGVVLVLAASSRYEEGVRNLARAPIGCVTSLEFAEAGTFVVYVETRGQISDLRGDCPNSDTDFDSSGGDLPDVDIVLVDDAGDEVELVSDDSKSYDVAGFIGQSVATVEIEEPGDFELTATSDEDEVAVAVGRTPKDDAASLRTTGIIVLAAGVLLGGLLLLLGLRRRGPAAPGSPGSPAAAAAPVGAAAPWSPAPPAAAPHPPVTAPPPTMPMPPVAPPPPPAPPAGGGWPAPPSH